MSQSVPSANSMKPPSRLLIAQRRTISLMRRVVAELRTGQSPEEIIQIAQTAQNPWVQQLVSGANGPVRCPKVGLPFGQSTALQHGMMVEINLSPTNDTAFGNLGHALVFGSDEEPEMLVQARELCRAACGFSNRFKCTVRLRPSVGRQSKQIIGPGPFDGSPMLPSFGRSNLHWPKMARAAIYLRRNQIGWFNYRRMDGIYAIQLA